MSFDYSNFRTPNLPNVTPPAAASAVESRIRQSMDDLPLNQAVAIGENGHAGFEATIQNVAGEQVAILKQHRLGEGPSLLVEGKKTPHDTFVLKKLQPREQVRLFDGDVLLLAPHRDQASQSLTWSLVLPFNAKP